MFRYLAILFASLAALIASPAMADVDVHFHSFNGSLFGGRYPHTFVVFEGELEDGRKVMENYGFSAKTASPAVLAGPVTHMVISEKPKYLKTTNRHFTITVSDAKFREMRAEVFRWRDAPGKYYDLKTRNCIHFVGKMAQMAGLSVDYPENMLRKPKAWLNHITARNPSLGAKQID
ncbi:hypothetical protein ACXYN8_09540 [Altererythrobacter sp. CAU 1778]